MGAYTSQPRKGAVGSGQWLSPIKTFQNKKKPWIPSATHPSPALPARHAEHLGLDVAAALDAAGIRAEELADNGKRMPSEAHERLLEHLMAVSGDPLFGLHSARACSRLVSARLHHHELRHPGRGDEPHRPLRETGGRHGHQPHRGCRGAHPPDLELPPRSPGDPPPHGGKRARLLAALRPLDRRHGALAPRVWFEHAQPAGTRLEDYEEVFGCPVRFGQTCNALLVPLEYLGVPLRQADANLLRTLEEHALALMAGLDQDEPLPQRVKNALRLLLKDGLPRKERVAENST